MEDSLLNSVIDFTNKAHGEQTRKYSPDQYIVHPIRVMKTCREYINDSCVLAAAIMHDVLEDTPTSKEEILDFLSPLIGADKAERTLQLVIELTDVYVKKDFPKLNRRTRKQKEAERLSKVSADAQLIKYADILDNSEEIVRDDPNFARAFLRECKSLIRLMDKGNKELRERTSALIEEKLKTL